MAYDIRLESGVNLHTFAKDKEFKQRLVDAIAIVLYEARKEASEDVKKYMHDDAREAFRAVHRSVYKKLIGGNMSILTQRKSLRRNNWIPKPSNRYGNRTGPVRGRTRRTLDFYAYNGIDRGMILRWINDSTKERYVTHMDGGDINIEARKKIREMRGGWHNKSKGERFKYSPIGGRGGAATIRTTTRGMFDKIANPNMSRAAEQLQVLIDKIIIDMF